MGKNQLGGSLEEGVLSAVHKTPDADKSPDSRFLRSFGRRHGKTLRAQRKGLLKEKLPAVTLDLERTVQEQFAPTTRTFWLEIGFGGGEHLVAQARAHRDVGLIGCEPYIDGVAKLLAQADEGELDNVRIHADDARQIFPAIPKAALERIFVLFPDPWPKVRHHKRRIIQDRVLDDFARMLADGGELRFASDHMGYVRWTLAHVMRHGDFEWIAQRPTDWRAPPADWVRTRYEQKALKRGDACVYLRFRRKPRT